MLFWVYVCPKSFYVFSGIGPILSEGFWVLDNYSQDVQRDVICPPLVRGEAMHEDASDDCLTELFGTG